MVKQHLKRLASPKTWPIAKKTLTFVARPFPGPHKMHHQIPISVFLRDMVGLAQTQKEVKKILHDKLCLVNGKIIHDNKRPVGLMDIISLPSINKFYRILINNNNKLYVLEISEKESLQKLSKVMKKTSIKGGKVQLNTLDGRNILVEDANTYNVGDSIVLDLPQQKINGHFPMQKGATILLDAGRHVGTVGTVKEIEGTIIVVSTKDLEFRTKRRYAIVIGKDKPIITL